MMLFLQRDVARQHPVGYEIRTKNIFDPNESEFPPPSGLKAAPLDEKSSDDVDESGDIIVGRKIGSRKSVTGATTSVCARRGCTNLPRFDSEFCSDACGVSAMEFDLLKSFQLASEVHPSMLR